MLSAKFGESLQFLREIQAYFIPTNSDMTTPGGVRCTEIYKRIFISISQTFYR
jgi:hypothetical protein